MLKIIVGHQPAPAGNRPNDQRDNESSDNWVICNWGDGFQLSVLLPYGLEATTTTSIPAYLTRSEDSSSCTKSGGLIGESSGADGGGGRNRAGWRRSMSTGSPRLFQPLQLRLMPGNLASLGYNCNSFDSRVNDVIGSYYSGAIGTRRAASWCK